MASGSAAHGEMSSHHEADLGPTSDQNEEMSRLTSVQSGSQGSLEVLSLHESPRAPLPTDVPLPESRPQSILASSTISRNSFGIRSSLEITAHLDQAGSTIDHLPATVPLPPHEILQCHLYNL